MRARHDFGRINFRILEKAEKEILTRDISIWLNEYDDIFSDFDSRPYSDRVMSDDFINELNKVSKENDLNINELKLLIPEKIRNKDIESVISKRLHEFFRKNYYQLKLHRSREILKNSLFFLTGTLLLISASFIDRLHSDSFFLSILMVVMEPGGWFLSWTSMEGIFRDLRKRRPELDFYSGMAKCKIVFIGFKS